MQILIPTSCLPVLQHYVLGLRLTIVFLSIRLVVWCLKCQKISSQCSRWRPQTFTVILIFSSTWKYWPCWLKLELGETTASGNIWDAIWTPKINLQVWSQAQLVLFLLLNLKILALQIPNNPPRQEERKGGGGFSSPGPKSSSWAEEAANLPTR